MGQVINGYILQIAQLVIVTIVAILAKAIKRLYEKYVNTQIKRDVVRTVVRCVEQIYVDLHGQDKLLKAMGRARVILEEKGIDIGDYELTSLIEAAVNEFNDTFHKAEPEQLQPPDAEEIGYGLTD